MQCHVHTSTHIQVKHAHFYMLCPMSRVLADSLTHALAMYENYFQNKIFLFLKLIGQPPISKPIEQPFDRKTHWTTLRYNLLDILQYNLLDNPPIKFTRQPSNKTALFRTMSSTHNRFTQCPRAHAMLMPLHGIYILHAY